MFLKNPVKKKQNINLITYFSLQTVGDYHIDKENILMAWIYIWVEVVNNDQPGLGLLVVSSSWRVFRFNLFGAWVQTFNHGNSIGGGSVPSERVYNFWIKWVIA